MSQENYTHVTFVVDRSGSMSDIAADMTGGIKTLIDEQFAEPGQITITLTQFDDTVETCQRLATAPFTYELRPRGSTALLDAVGREIVKTGEDLAALPEDKRPARVLFVVVTDGMENASSEFRLAQVRDLIAQQTGQYGWQFQFLGAEEAAWQGGDLGMKQARFAKTRAGSVGSLARINSSLKQFRADESKFADFYIDEDIED